MFVYMVDDVSHYLFIETVKIAEHIDA